ncbi:MAG TPA: class I SAM-dependent methyltransferase [Albitalea sp.]|uniref:class I SAM-dependent methyltransferase n=1 Tax=Piscinibacter sp. TaxID=1903157 RepID=UPI002ED69BD2
MQAPIEAAIEPPLAGPSAKTSPPAPRCMLCASETRLRLTMPLDAKTFKATAHGQVYGCERCAFGFVHPRPTPAQTSSFYELDAYYTQGASHMVATPPPGWLSRLRMNLAWRADRSESLIDVMEQGLAPNSAVVDVGCGTGMLLRQLAERGHHATGVERDTSAVSLRHHKVRVLEGSAEALPAALAPASCDALVFSHVLEHLVDPIAAVRRASALLKPGGLLFCEVPNNESLIARQSGLAWEHLDIPRHINFFTERSLAALVQDAGLEIRRVYFTGYCRFFADSYIATEQRIYDRLAAVPGGTEHSVRNSAAQAWRLLARTAWAAPRRKYDSVGVVAAWPAALA